MTSYPDVPNPVPEGTYPQTSNLAIISLISGIASWVILPLIGAVIAIITGHMARNEIRDSMGRITGDGLAVAGLALGYVHLVVAFLCFLIPLCLLAIAILLGLSTGDWNINLSLLRQGLPAGM